MLVLYLLICWGQNSVYTSVFVTCLAQEASCLVWCIASSKLPSKNMVWQPLHTQYGFPQLILCPNKTTSYTAPNTAFFLFLGNTVLGVKYKQNCLFSHGFFFVVLVWGFFNCLPATGGSCFLNTINHLFCFSYHSAKYCLQCTKKK